METVVCTHILTSEAGSLGLATFKKKIKTGCSKNFKKRRQKRNFLGFLEQTVLNIF